MAIERTFSIIKPDATRRNLTGKIIAKFEEAGLRIVASKRIRMTRAQAEGFYAVHKDRPFFGELVEFMISGPVVVQVLEGEGAVTKNREVMGATNPANAAPGTIRKEFAESVGENSVHGSDAPETAAEEISSSSRTTRSSAEIGDRWRHRPFRRARRTDAMPEIVVYAVEGRSPAAKKALMQDITAAVVKNFGVPPERVVVQIVESGKDSKSRGGVPFAEL